MYSILLSIDSTLLLTTSTCKVQKEIRENMCIIQLYRAGFAAQAPLHQPKQRFLVCSEKLLSSLGFTFQYSILRGRAM